MAEAPPPKGRPDALAALAAARDGVLAFLPGSGMDPSSAVLRAADARKLHADLALARGLLDAEHERGSGRTGLCAVLLHGSRGCLERLSASLDGLGTDGARALAAEIREAFDAAWAPLALELEARSRDEEAAGPAGPRVVAAPSGELRLPCAACGKAAAVFRRAPAGPGGQDDLVYEGIVVASPLGPEHAQRVLAWLEMGAIASVHAYLAERRVLERGLDAYCPECDRTYCREHYSVSEAWEDGLYGGAAGTCPAGHSRVLDGGLAGCQGPCAEINR